MSGGISASTIAAASLAASAVGTGVAMYGQSQQAAAQSQAANYQSAVARNNAIIANQNAQAALDAGQAQEQQQRLKTAGLIGAERATMAANGVELDSGSALNVQSSAASLGELDALTVRSNAARQAYGYQTQATNFGAQAQLDNSQASWASATGQIGMASSFLGGASQFGNTYATDTKTFNWGN